MSGYFCGTPSEEELSKIARFCAGEAPGADELFVFSLDLADDLPDRDGERFDAATLRELAPMFVGKCGIFDHDWSAKGQTARLFECEAVRDGERTVLRGRAYMLRRGNEKLVAEIEAGIKREVSVACAVRARRCSVCGDESGGCGHLPGELYGGRLCVRELVGARDAYEWSFVAVPAQRRAGVGSASVERSLSAARAFDKLGEGASVERSLSGARAFDKSGEGSSVDKAGGAGGAQLGGAGQERAGAGGSVSDRRAFDNSGGGASVSRKADGEVTDKGKGAGGAQLGGAAKHTDERAGKGTVKVEGTGKGKGTKGAGRDYREYKVRGI